jgi:heme/copper-type cytochrome/quinol oxidase subunit 2
MPGGQKRTASPDKTAKRFSLHFTLEYISSYIDIYIFIYLFIFTYRIYYNYRRKGKQQQSKGKDKCGTGVAHLFCSVLAPCALAQASAAAY